MPQPTSEWTAAAVPQADERSMRRLRFSQWVVFGSLGFCALVILLMALLQLVVEAADGTPSGILGLVGLGRTWYAVAVLVLATALAWLTVWMIGSRLAGGLRRLDPGTPLRWSFALLLGLVAVMDVTAGALMIAAVWWSAAALVTTRRTIAGLTAALVAFLVGYALLLSSQPLVLSLMFVGYGCLAAVLFVVGNLTMLWLWEIAREATLAREARARLAVSEERLRFARDMHDLLGHSLSGIAVKSELAARLAPRDPERAAAEMAQVQQIAREALREVRAAVSGYRAVDLADELASVCSVLTAAGVHTTVAGDPAAFPERLRPPVAWLIREGATNVLRHSTARRCDITLAERNRTLVVEVYNDGVRPGRGTVFGNGLTGLSERAATVGGTLSATCTGDGGYLLRAVFPVRGGASPLREGEAKEVSP